jgi:hypothetical protein
MEKDLLKKYLKLSVLPLLFLFWFLLYFTAVSYNIYAELSVIQSSGFCYAYLVFFLKHICISFCSRFFFLSLQFSDVYSLSSSPFSHLSFSQFISFT